MNSDQRLVSERFPRSSQYHPEWVMTHASGGANALWLTEWLTTVLDLRPGMRVLDLGCGRAASSIFLRSEFGVQVWATDLWFSASENIQRIRDAGIEDVEGPVPDHLREFWTQDLWCLHSAAWWRRHWERTHLVDIEVADTMPDGWHVWLDWQRTACPDNTAEIRTVEVDRGRYLGYVRLVGRRQAGVRLEDYCWPNTMRSAPVQYTRKPLLRTEL